MKVYGDIQSGNCYKVKLLCSLLDIDHEWIHVNILAGESLTEAFLVKNPTGKIPLLELVDGRCLSESNAILNYLAYNSKLMPTDAFQIAKVQQWQFFEQYNHEPFIAVARFIAKFLGLPEDRRDEYESRQKGGHRALAIMDARLQSSPYLACDFLTTADISLYGYTHVADEGGFDLSLYPAIEAWIKRISQHPKYTGMS